METGAAGVGLLELLLLLLCGQFQGAVPGERDPQFIKSPPAAAYFYREWTGAGPAVVNAPGLSGLLADPEIEAFLEALGQSLTSHDPARGEEYDEVERVARAELPTLLRLLLAHPGCLYISGPTLAEEPQPMIPLEGAIVLQLGDDLPGFLASLNRVLQQALLGYRPADVPADSEIPYIGVPLTLHQAGTRLILSFGTGTRARLMSRWDAPAAALPQQEKFRLSLAAVRTEKFGSLSWVNFAAIRDDLQTRWGVAGAVVQGVAKSLGLSELDVMLTVSGTEAESSVTRTRMALPDQRSGLLKLLGGRPLTAADFRDIPADADFVAAASLDLRVVQATVRDIVQATVPEALGGLEEFQRQLELELRLKLDDLIQAFGDVVTVYDSPTSGGLAMTGLVVALPVRNADRAQAVVDRWREMMLESLPPATGEITTALVEMPFSGETIHVLNTTGYMVRHAGQLPWTPSFCLTKQQLLVAVHPQAIKGHLRFVTSREPRYPRLPKFPVDSGDDMLACLAVKTPQIARGVYPFVPLLAKPFLAEHTEPGNPLHAGVIPSARAVVPYLQDASLVVIRRPEALMIEQRNMLPVWLAALFLPQLSPDGYDIMQDEEGMMGRKSRPVGAPAVSLGMAEGVTPAKAEVIAKPEPKPPGAVEKAARRTIPFFIRSLIPDEVEHVIPNSVFEKLAAPPDPVKAARRQADLERRREERAARKAARKLPTR